MVRSARPSATKSATASTTRAASTTPWAFFGTGGRQRTARISRRVDRPLARQYDAYSPLPGLHVNGKLTLGENIADLAGLVIAYKAYHLALGGKPAPVLNGLTGDQRFYIAYGQSWREIWTEGQTRRTVLSNPHSPPKYRVNGVVRNDDGWYAAFPGVKPGDALLSSAGSARAAVVTVGRSSN